jgi:diguanylate cyclase (GGDEF)-like protein
MRSIVPHLIYFLENQSRLVLISLILSLIGLITLLDTQVPPEVFLAIFYFVPVYIASWFIGRQAGILASLASAASWLLVSYEQGFDQLHCLIPYCNAGAALVFFLSTTYILSALREALLKAEKLACVDALTGVTNRRHFVELANLELNRALRHQSHLTLAYLDVDNFKALNDQFGHTVGDQVLKLVAQTIKDQLRQSDVIARLGGDEFAILLPETDYESAAIALRRIQLVLLSLMQQHGWATTFSIGAITFTRSPSSVEFMLDQADRLMYHSKHRGKNRLHHQTLDGVVATAL